MLTNSTVSDNTATSYIGGGVISSSNIASSAIHLMNSTISGNYGRGISGYHNLDATLTNSTVSGNTGEGIYLLYGFASLSNSTVSGNTSLGINVVVTAQVLTWIIVLLLTMVSRTAPQVIIMVPSRSERDRIRSVPQSVAGQQ